MSFKDIESEIKPFYHSFSSDVVNDFYNKVLSESVRYDRIIPFFSSNSLAITSKGIANFIIKGGHMRLLCGADLTKSDVEAIKNANDLKDYINKNFIDEYENLQNEIAKDHVKFLGWMIANNLLEIKIGIPVDENGDYSLNSVLHLKIGLLYDENEDCIMFNGAPSEIQIDGANNIEILDVFKSWKDRGEIFIQHKEHFEELWNGQNDHLMVFDVPEATKKQLIKIAPESKDELENILK